jgi:hypothetical protein
MSFTPKFLPNCVLVPKAVASMVSFSPVAQSQGRLRSLAGLLEARFLSRSLESLAHAVLLPRAVYVARISRHLNYEPILGTPLGLRNWGNPLEG